MKTKAKKFSHKLLALFMAIVMGITCFSGTFSAFAASSDVKYHDDAVEYNSLAWKVLSDEQVATALLDYADEMLAEYGPAIDNLLAGFLPSSGIYYYNKSSRTFELDVKIIKASVKIYTHSVDEIMETLESVQSLLNSYGGMVGTLGKLDLTSTSGMRRAKTSSCDIIKGVLGILQKNFSTYNGKSSSDKDPIGDILRGDFTLGTLGTFVKLDLYGEIGKLLNMDDGYESNLVYNIAQQLIFDNGRVAADGTKWYSDEDIAAYKNGTKTWVYDDQLLDIFTTKLFNRISALITYNETEIHQTDENGKDVKDENGDSIVLIPRDTSESRYAEIKEVMDAENKTYAEAAAKLGYDPNLVYSDEFVTKSGVYQNVLLFAYGSPDEKGLATKDTKIIRLSKTDSLFGFGLQALQMVWDTALKDTVKLVHVNFDRDKGHGSNFDNAYYYWMYANHKWTGNKTVDYSAENVEAWMTAVHKTYGAESVEEFKSWVLDNVSYDRSVVEDQNFNWSDIDSTTLFNKLRYSPLADLYFNIQTGPCNLYFLQLGTENLDKIFAEKVNTGKYSSMVAGLNDVLVAAVKDIFVDSANVEGSLPKLKETGDLATINASSIATISSTLVENTMAMVQYVADATDKNILSGFYKTYGTNATLSESNLEEAMIPMLIACIGQVNLGGGKLERVIHPKDWNACQDAEAVAFVCLREYLSYILPTKNYDVLVNQTADQITAKNGDMLNNVIMPMARDAVSYVMQGYVPVTDKNNAPWNVYDRAVDDSATILDLLNSVICYYGGEYSFKNPNVTKSSGAMAVGALLGACDSKTGKSLISMDNDIWTNIDLVANKLLPLLGQLQYNDTSKRGQFSSKDLIWNDVVLGVLDIDDTSIHSSGQCGVTNFINRLLTIVSADPIQKTPVINTVYNFLADLFNGLFGARYDGQGYKEVVPANTSDHPFDDLAQKATLIGSKNGEAGILHKMIDNLVEFFGFGTSGVNTYPDSIIRGACFALQALNSFLPDVMPGVGNHSLKMPTSEFAVKTVTGATSGTPYTSDVTLKNNCTGVNDAYVDGKNDTVEQFGRYYIKVTGAQASSTNGAAITLTNTTSDFIAPGEKFTTSATANYNGTDGSYRIDFSFDVYIDQNGTKTKLNDTSLTSSCYKYITKNISWADTVYPASRNGMMPESLESNSADQTMTLNGFRTFTSGNFLSGSNANVLYPEYFVLDNQNLGAISGYQVRFRNNNNGTKGMDGIYTYDDKTVYDDNTGTNVTVNNTNAIPVFDRETGDLIKYGKFDYSLDDGKTWVTNYQYIVDLSYEHSNERYNAGFDEDQLQTVVDGLTAEQKEHFVRRDCHVFTIEDLKANGNLAAYHVNEKTGLYDYIYLKTNTNEYAIKNGKYDIFPAKYAPARYDTLLGLISMKGAVDGLYIPAGKLSLEKNSSTYTVLFQYDGTTDIPAGRYDVNVACYSSGGIGGIGSIANPGKPCTLIVADTSSRSQVTTAYNELAKLLADYESTDFVDYANGASAQQNAARQALITALQTESAVLNDVTAGQLSDNQQVQAVVADSTKNYGDPAYIPFDASTISAMPKEVLANSYEDENGLYYYDEACTLMIYTNQKLAEIKDFDATGATEYDEVYFEDGKWYNGYSMEEVVPVTDKESGITEFYVPNTVKYVQEWDATGTVYTYPWLKNTDVQATNSKKEALFNQTQFVYRDANGKKVNSTDKWVCKFADTSLRQIPNTGEAGSIDNRGLYTQTKDMLNYTIEQTKAKISKASAEMLYNDITLVRTGLNNNNFEVITFNKMVDAAQNAEAYYSVIVTYTDKDGKEQKETLKPTDAIKTMKSLDEEKIAYTMEIDSTLSATQANEYKRLFDFYMSKVIERGYVGDSLEAEIECASGNTWDKLKATPATYDEEGNVVTPAKVEAKGAVTAAHGKFVNGVLVNEGTTVYSTQTWDAYIAALADAVALAETGNVNYAHPTADYFDFATYANEETNDYKAQVATCYHIDTTLQKAEIALTPAESATVTVVASEGATVTVDGTAVTAPVAYQKGETITIDVQYANGYESAGYIIINGDKKFVELPYTMELDSDVTIEAPATKLAPTGITVSGTIKIAIDETGTSSTIGIGGINVIANGEVVATSAADGTFTATVPAGTTELTIQGSTTIDRVVTLSGTADVNNAEIPVVICDYNGDKLIDATDLGIFLSSYNGENIYCEFSGDGNIDATDLGIFLAFYGVDITYNALALD